MAMNTFQKQQSVKFYQRTEPCIIYRVVDEAEQMLWSELLHKTCPHVKLEVIGMAPVELLSEVDGHYQNMFALDKLLWIGDRTN